MEYTIKLTPKAQEDIEAIFNYVLKDGESIAKNQVKYIIENIEKLKSFPEIGVKLSTKIASKTDYRYIVIKKIYIAFYKIHKDFIGIYRVLRKEQDYLRVLGL